MTSCQSVWHTRIVLRNVAVVVVNGFLPFEFGTICEVFGVDRADDRLPSYELSVVAGEPPPVRAHNDFTIASLLRAGAAGGGGPDRAARGRRRPALHLCGPGQAGRGAGLVPALPCGTAGGAAPGGGPGHPGAEHVHRGLHPGRGRAAGRPPLHHALAERGGTRPALPGGQGRSRRPLRRRRPGDHQRGHSGRHRRVPLPGQEGAGLADRQRHRPAHGGAAAPRRRPGAVRRPAGRPLLRRDAAGPARVAARAPGPAADRAPAGRAGEHVRADLRPPLRAGHRHHAATLADRAAHPAGPATAGGERRDGGRDRRPGRVRQRDRAAPPLPRLARHHPPRLPAPLPGRYRVQVARSGDRLR